MNLSLLVFVNMSVVCISFSEENSLSGKSQIDLQKVNIVRTKNFFKI